MMDLLVLGAGVAGCSAALAGRAAGARVTVVRATPGASALVGGGWRGERGRAPAALVDALAAAGHPLVPARGALPHVNGFLDPAELAPPWHGAALPLEGVLVCGVRGLPAVNAPFLARAWSAPPLAAAVLELPDTPAGGWSPVALAGVVERAPERLGEAVAARARELGATRVLLPPMLGLERAHETWRAATAAAGVSLAEAVGGWPSLPGWRLDRALARVLAAAGVELVEARAVGARNDGATGAAPRLAAVALADGRELSAGAFVLATGKFVGGGIAAEPALRESVLALPVWVDRLGERFHDAAPVLTTELGRAGPHPLLAAGVRTDAQGRPLDERGEVVLGNVRVAGAVRHGHESAELGLCDAAADGWHAALSVLESA